MPKGSLQAEWHSLGIGAAQIWRLTALGQGTEKGSASSPGTAIGLLGRNRNQGQAKSWRSGRLQLQSLTKDRVVSALG